MNYYSLSYSTDNVGDEIQMVAARQHYPRIDGYIDRDRLATDSRSLPPGKIVLNGWYMHYRGFRPAWPPPPHIQGLCVSMHVYKKNWFVRSAFASARSREYLREHGPVGARDKATKEFFESIGVPSYVSGCMTMTLKSKGYPKTGPVVFCDAWGHDRSWRYYGPDEYLPSIRHLPLDLENARHVTHVVEPGAAREDREGRVRRAEELIDLYDRASLVVTTRLHCALPCIAMGTPVIFFGERQHDARYTNWENVLKVRSRDEFIAGNITPDSRPPLTEWTDGLTQACVDFFAE